MIKGIIFDLDLCILDTHSLTGDFFKPVLDPLYQSDLDDNFKKKINDLLWTTSLDDVVEILSVPEHVANPMREAYRNLEVPQGIKSYGDENVLETLEVTKLLVTSGYKKFQSQKIEMLGIGMFFSEIIIDELDYREHRRGKKKIFGEILARYEWSNREVLVVGDNPTSELGAARALGVTSVQTLRPTVTKWDEADFHISSLTELQSIIATN
jgi:FMN phosphatase YigB (HAD superfamily)